ncbi:MAG: methyl-accepting chemotaxis protein [Lachnospiraceae bacterium]|nr:methyl-accepting chemotaxis protein [Lachnospiraceae bacterium]MDE6999360.1 methyl-accepting chemotaxis protein [Lachnospiraceae bacterium]
MEKKKEAPTSEALGKNSQVARLRKIVKQTNFSLVLGIVLLVLLFFASISYAVVSNEQLESTMYLNQYRLGSKALTTAVQSYAVSGNTMYYDDYMRELNTDKNRDIALAGLEANNIKDHEWAELNEITALSNNLVPLEEDAMAAVAAGDVTAATEYVFGKEYSDTIQKINSLTDDVITKIQDRLDASKKLFMVIQIICAVAFLAGFIRLAQQCLRTIHFSQTELLTPIIKVSDQMELLADGNLHADLDLQEDDSEVGNMVAAIRFMKDNMASIIEEISYILEQMGQGNYILTVNQNYVGEYVKIKDSFNKIMEDMRGTVSTIQEVAREIDSGSAQLAYAADDLATACTGQATEVSELMQLLTELGNSIRYNEQEAEEAVKISNLASSTLTVGSQKMDELREAMKEISQCSEQIISVIAAISDIGDEIDLLSLNASIESARAGEAGRGFAVVAEQVKKLAEASQNAVGQTSELIERTVQSVEVGTRISREAAANMEEVQMGAEETTGRINGIVDKLKLEVESIAHINESIGVVAGIVDNNSATSEETAAVSEQQKAQVESMVDMMSRFKV